MQRFFENKLAFVGVALLFALAFLWNVSHAASTAARPDVIMEAYGPTPPPPPWEEIRVAAAPAIPQRPSEQVRAAL
jgi:hypothetical protein